RVKPVYINLITQILSRRKYNLKEEEIADILLKENEEYKKLGDEHKSLKEALAEIDRKIHLTPEEEVERKRIQKLKLVKKDRMAELIREYKKSHSTN
ncbi:MAG: hypothetical protein QMD07_08170, partial [Thermodesulfovibrionales bacterium]|nr:hypothetical protein [Thermodesulfovibrionales bacterium]